MAIDPKLLVIKPVNELQTVTGLQAGDLLFYDKTNPNGTVLKKISIDTFNNLSKTAKPLKPTDPTPTVEGLYMPTEPGTYANAGGLVAQEGYYTLFFFDVSTWTKSEVEMPKPSQNIPQFENLAFPVANTSSEKVQTVYNSSIWQLADGQTATISDVPALNSPKWRNITKEIKKIDEYNGDITFVGSWSNAGGFRTSNVANNTIFFRSEGNILFINYLATGDGGIANVYANDVLVGSYDSSVGTDGTHQSAVFEVGEGSHEIKINVEGVNGSTGIGSYVTFLSYEYYVNNSGISTILQCYSDEVRKVGRIQVLNEPISAVDVTTQTNTAGDYIEFDFVGTYVEINGMKANYCGNYDVYIDDVLISTVSGFSSVYRESVLFAKSGLEEKPHTLRIVLRNDNPSASNYLFFTYARYSTKNNIYAANSRRIEFGINATDWGILPDGTDQTENLQNLLDYVNSDDNFLGQGKKIFFPKGRYKFNGNIRLWQTDGLSYPISLIGETMISNGRQDYYGWGGTIFDFNQPSGDYGRFYAVGNNSLEISGITFNVTNGSHPIIKTMYTRLHIHGCAFLDMRSLLTPRSVDAIILGGEVEYEDVNPIDNGGFQGYGTVIRDNHFNGIRRMVYGKVFANGVSVCDNMVWKNSGSNLTNGACIEFDNVDANGVQHNSGGYIAGNLIEMHGYNYAIKLMNTIGFAVVGNNIYDPIAAIAVYYLGEKAERNTILPGFMPVTGSGYGNIKVLEDHSINKNNRFVWGDVIDGDINKYPD